jgi:hypothetical protein
MAFEGLRDIVIEQAKYFLEKAGEFYPFGSAVDQNGTIIPIGVQLENDFSQPHEVISFLERVMIQKLKNHEAEAVVLGTDVTYKPAGGTEIRSAIQVRMLRSDGDSIDYYLPYQNRGGRFTYEEFFVEKGTLNFLRVI